jgi:hypothetical protein
MAGEPPLIGAAETLVAAPNAKIAQVLNARAVRFAVQVIYPSSPSLNGNVRSAMPRQRSPVLNQLLNKPNFALVPELVFGRLPAQFAESTDEQINWFNECGTGRF